MALEKESDRAHNFSRRAFIIGAFQAGMLTLLGGRLAWLQVVEGNRYKTLAENNRINLKMMAPARGQIVDRFGVPFAVNKQNFRVLVVPEQTDDLEQSLRALQKHIKIDDAMIEKTIKLAKKSPSYTPIEVADELNWEEVATVEVNIPDLPGMSIDMGEVRQYPFAESAAHIIGYVGTASKKDQENDKDPLLTLPDFQVGKSGIEKTLDPYLRGKAGSSEVEVNVVGREVRELNNLQSQEGSRVVLSIDAELQRFAMQRMTESKSASAVVMDVHTGEIYALASYPAYDPNYFTGGISHERYEELRSDITFPLTNKAVAGQYPPGSTFKMVTALAALEAGVITEGTGTFCPGHYEFGNGLFHCWKKGGHGTVNVVGALEQSCDVFFYKLSTDLGIKRIADMARRLGLGAKFEMELSEERAGLVPDEAWKRKARKEGWHPGETVIASIGQGYMLATPLQLAVMTSRIVNGGLAVKPWLTGGIGGNPVAHGPWDKIDIDPRHVEIVMRGMDRVCNGERGTAKAARIKEPGMEMGGKSGTAQVKRITKQERAAGVKNEDLPWQFRHHALFVGYAPLTNPRYACSVVVEHGVGGSSAAAPIVRDLLLLAQQRDPASKPMAAAPVILEKGKHYG
ncbi:MAG: penicillin-binding protein 2 [Micavibrio aeruginosavorus]|uniref:Penicillin-binding protein 2 n=1 Tax=Micavibrio aeruginosavorus TaxID=349221 RepID=A0A2W5N5F0_9BACT|nr:MAG: penicillin-binding protein 2 [Micavibrio aeruginosavorus]